MKDSSISQPDGKLFRSKKKKNQRPRRVNEIVVSGRRKLAVSTQGGGGSVLNHPTCYKAADVKLAAVNHRWRRYLQNGHGIHL